MPKVYEATARKDYPGDGIKKGQVYFSWYLRNGMRSITRRSLTRPRESQLTASEYKSQAHGFNERIADFSCDTVDDFEAFRDELKSDAENLQSEVEGNRDNMPEGLQQGPTGELLQSRIDALEAFVGELDGIDIDRDKFPEEKSEEEEEEEEEEGDDKEYEFDSEADYVASLIEELTNISLDVE